MVSKIFSAAPIGVDGHLIEIEASRENALPQIHITGLPGAVVKESRDRIRSSLQSIGGTVPSGRVTLHLSPASLPKSGSHYDLGMALSLLGAEERLDSKTLSRIGALGELSLDGRVRKVSGAVSLIEGLTAQNSIELVFLPLENELEARIVGSKKVRLVSHISECIEIVQSTELLPSSIEPIGSSLLSSDNPLDLVMGQTVGKRALEIALAGGHHLLLVGAPGVGKTLLATCAEALLPELSAEERVILHKIYGSPGISEEVPSVRPFRMPHHSISQQGLLGGGSTFLVPGEVSLAHQGVLFLDELPEFRRDSLEGLREPLQMGRVHHRRASCVAYFPAKFVLLAAMNPCPCGYAMSRTRHCRCIPERVQRYQHRLSGPFLDRLDLAVLMQDSGPVDSSFKTHEEVRASVAEAREKLKMKREFTLESSDEAWLEERGKKEGLSYRTKKKIVNVAGTIATLEKSENIKRLHLTEAWGFRCTNLFNRYQI